MVILARLLALVIAGAIPLIAAGAPGSADTPQPTLFVSPTGSDSGSCTQASPCQSFDRAYHVAKPGQVVTLEAGTYPKQTVTPDQSKQGPAVVFQPQRPHSVQVADLTIEGSHVEFDDLSIPGIWYVGVNSSTMTQAAQPHDVTLRDVRATEFFITGATGVSVIGGSYGPAVDNASQIKGCEDCRYAPTNILIDGVTFHDYTRTKLGTHMECLHVYPAQELTIRDSRFLNCAIMDLFLSNYGPGGDLKDITIENNAFDLPGSHAGALSRGYYPLAFGGFNRSITNVRIAYNSLVRASIPGFDSSAHYKNIVIEANVGGLDQRFCSSGVTFAYNVWTDAKCGPTDTTAPSDFVDPGRYDFQLQRGAPAIGHGDPNHHPATDLEGRLRPSRTPADAGAYERETALIVLGKSIGTAAIGERVSRLTAFYGPAAGSTSIRSGGRSLRRLVYRVPRGSLWVLAAAGKVVGVGTSSRSYETVGAVGAGASIGRIRRLSGVAWIGCRKAYRRSYRDVSVYFTPRGGRSGSVIGSVTMMAGEKGCT